MSRDSKLKTFRLRFRGKLYEIVAPLNDDGVDAVLDKAVRIMDLHDRVNRGVGRREVAVLERDEKRRCWVLKVLDAEKHYVIEEVYIR